MANLPFDVFPSDLSSDYYNHWMTITAYTTNGPYTGSIGNNLPGYTPNKIPAYSAILYIPGGAGDFGMMYDDSHEFTDIKLSNMGPGIVGAAAGLAGAAVGGPVVGAAAGVLGAAAGSAAMTAMKVAGRPINPGVEVIYNTTKRRGFSFVFLMAPSSQKESDAMKSIIKNLRMYAAPEAINSTNNVVMRAPAEFQIKFFHKNEENENIPKIRRCVLSRIDVNFTPNNEWSTFKNGHPVSCMLMLNFEELEIIHRDFVSQGF